MSDKPKITLKLVRELAKELGLTTKKESLKVLQKGMIVELEHWETVEHDIHKVLLIVLDHLKEFDNYYDALDKMEKQLREDYEVSNRKHEKQSN